MAEATESKGPEQSNNDELAIKVLVLESTNSLKQYRVISPNALHKEAGRVYAKIKKTGASKEKSWELSELVMTRALEKLDQERAQEFMNLKDQNAVIFRCIKGQIKARQKIEETAEKLNANGEKILKDLLTTLKPHIEKASEIIDETTEATEKRVKESADQFLGAVIKGLSGIQEKIKKAQTEQPEEKK